MQPAAEATAALLTETALNCGRAAPYHCDESAYQRCMSAPLSKVSVESVSRCNGGGRCRRTYREQRRRSGCPARGGLDGSFCLRRWKEYNMVLLLYLLYSTYVLFTYATIFTFFSRSPLLLSRSLRLFQMRMDEKSLGGMIHDLINPLSPSLLPSCAHASRK